MKMAWLALMRMAWLWSYVIANYNPIYTKYPHASSAVLVQLWYSIVTKALHLCFLMKVYVPILNNNVLVPLLYEVGCLDHHYSQSELMFCFLEC